MNKKASNPPPPTETATEPQDEVLAGLIEVYESQLDGDDDEFCNWYLRMVAEADAAEKRLEEMFQLMMREIHYRRLALQYVKGPMFMQKVKIKLAAQKGKKKSVNFLMGVSGFRSSRESITFKDEEAATGWAYTNIPVDDLMLAVSEIKRTPAVMAALQKLPKAEFIAAIKGLNKTPFHDHVKKEGEMPDGVELKPAEDKFYPWFDISSLPIVEPKTELEGGDSK